MYKHIIFDFGGVFLNLGEKYTTMPNALSRIFNVTQDRASEYWRENKEKLLIGKETPRKFLEEMSKELGVHIDLEKAYESWRSYHSAEKEQIDWKLLEYVRHLKKNYKIHMLTDAIDLDRESSRWTSEVDRHFNNVFKSYEEKLKKPDRKAFLNALKKIKARPEECLFVDDLKANVDAANELGIKGILFTNSKALKADFKKLGIA